MPLSRLPGPIRKLQQGLRSSSLARGKSHCILIVRNAACNQLTATRRIYLKISLTTLQKQNTSRVIFSIQLAPFGVNLLDLRAFDLTAMPLIYPQLTNATLAGTDHMNSIAVWHIHGTLTAADSFYTGKTDTAVLDVYLRQDNYLPVKLLAHVTTPDTIQDDTFVYTAFNTGVTILLPTVGQ